MSLTGEQPSVDDAHAERCSRCGNLMGDTDCTPYTCTYPCADCGHIGDVHRDWYVHLGEKWFCRQCPEGSAHWHDYVPAPVTDTNLGRQHA